MTMDPINPELAPRLLVVDDEQVQLEALCEVLRQEGHEVLGCPTPEEALVALRRQRFDILLSDLHLPQMDGIALTRQALAIDPDIVPVLMTGQGTISTAVEAMKVGAHDFVLKPFRIASMRPVLARALEVRRLRLKNRQLADAVAQRTAQLEAANRELDAFAARIAHDLRGPLLGMLGFVRVVRDDNTERLDVQSLGYLERVIIAGERADRMIADLLAFARLGDSPIRREPVELDAVLREARQMLDPQTGGRAIEWRIGSLPTVRGDPSLLEQVFVNLLSNALKFTRTREHARIEVASRTDRQIGHTISVRDNGVGFDPAQAGRLFIPFQRLHRADQFEGSGIGLAHVKRIVDRHGGSVRVESQPDKGATFLVTLPT
jgi:signal transduction histidine kinase